MTRRLPALALCVAVVFGALTTGCTTTVAGIAMKAKGSVPGDDVPLLDKSDLGDLLLSNRELDEISGLELESFYDSEEMNDNADLISDADCVGAVYPGEAAVYGDGDWTAVRDELLLEADAEQEARLVEQTVVLFDSREAAVEFFETSKDDWNTCARASDITVEDGGWVPHDVEQVNERLIAQKADVSGTLEGICQHAIGTVSNVVVEGYSCDADDHDDAEQIAGQILENAAQK